MKTKEQLISQWKEDEKAVFKGWDFSYLKKRMIDENPLWNYDEIAKKLIKKSKSVLDMATGGGEVFSEILSVHRPEEAIAIEGYKPNVSITRKRLLKQDVKVIYADETKKLPFKNKEFELVLNRHGGFNFKELERVLSPKGIFFTQQVDSRNLEDLMKRFGTKTKWPNNTLKTIKKQLKFSGFKIISAKEWKGKTIFKDIGAIVYYLKAIPWVVENFSIEKHKNYLIELQKDLERNGKLEFKITRFTILAEKIKT